MKIERLVLPIMLSLVATVTACKKKDESASTKQEPATTTPKTTATDTPPSGSGPANADDHAATGAQHAPTNLRDASTHMDAAHQELRDAVKAADMKKAHVAANKIAAVGDALPALAKTAGVTQPDIDALSSHVAQLRPLFKQLDKHGHGNKTDDMNATFAKYEENLAAIKAKLATAK